MGDRPNNLSRDIDHIVHNTGALWEELRGQRVFITGGTGFFGRWILDSFVNANRRLNLKASILVLTRDDKSFLMRAPHLANDPAVRFLVGDVRTFSFPDMEFSHIIHAAATSAVVTFQKVRPLETYEIITEGTRRTLDFAVHCRAKKVLLTSSGSIYGTQPPDLTNMPEDYRGAPDSTDPNSVIGEAKRAAEMYFCMYAYQYGFEAKIARCFSFVGPYLQLDIHYAIGNFIRDAVNGNAIAVNGDGTPYRSYLYAADLAVWLWTILFRGASCRAYNVGSEDGMTIANVAHAVARRVSNTPEVRIAKVPLPGVPPDRYVPSTRRAQDELGLKQTVPFDEAVDRTIAHINANRGLYFRTKSTA